MSEKKYTATHPPITDRVGDLQEWIARECQEIEAALKDENVLRAGLRAVAGVSALRGIRPENDVLVYLSYHTTAGDGGHGVFRGVTGASAGTYTDDNGITIVPTGGDGSSAWIRQFSGAVNVKWFGAKGDYDGSSGTDNTSLFQSAVNAAQNGTTGVVYIPRSDPSKTYKVTDSVSITKPIRIVGDGINLTTIQGVGLATGKPIFDFDGTVNPNFEFGGIGRMTLMGGNTAGVIKLNNVSQFSFDDIGYRNTTNGIYLTGNRVFSLKFERVKAITTVTGTDIKFDNVNGGQFSFRSCSFSGDTGVSIAGASTYVNGILFDNCNFESNATNAVYFNAALISSVTFNCCRIEKGPLVGMNFVPSTSGWYVRGVAFVGCFWETDTGVGSRGISLGGSSGNVRGITFIGNYCQDYDTFIYLNGDGESVLISSNRLTNVNNIVNVVRTGVLIVNNEDETSKVGPQWNPPLTTPSYTTTNVVTDRTYDADATTVDELADVLGTLIADLKSVGIIS